MQKVKKIQKNKKYSGLYLFILQIGIFQQKIAFSLDEHFFRHLIKASRFLINTQKRRFPALKKDLAFHFHQKNIKKRPYTPQSIYIPTPMAN
jgi:hypothetical protein